MSQRLMITLPMAGWGTRMRPHTWSKPKALCRVAGQTTLDYVLRQFQPLHQWYDPVEYVFILSSVEHRDQIQAHVAAHHPSLHIHYAMQTVMDGQSTAIQLAAPYLQGPMVMAFADTLIDADFSMIPQEPGQALAWGVRVDQPQHYGVAQIGNDGFIQRIKEKPQEYIGSLAMAGCYYFPHSTQLLRAIQRQIERGIHKDEDDPADASTREYYLVPALNILIREDHLKMKVVETDAMYDSGRPDTMLLTNRHLLEKYWGQQQSAYADQYGDGVVIIPPVYIAPRTRIHNAVIGPNVSIGEGCQLENVEICHSIIGTDCKLHSVRLDHSLLGDRVEISDDKSAARSCNLGDDCTLRLEKPAAGTAQTSVRCQSSAGYADKPLSFFWDNEWLEVDAILSRWRNQSGRGFRVRAKDMRQFTLFYEEGLDCWQIDRFQAPE